VKKKWILIAILIFLVVGFAVSIPLVNNQMAKNAEKQLLELPLPEKTTVADSLWAAGKLTGNGNGMQYFGAMLIKSELTLNELSAHYSQKLPNAVVKEQSTQRIACIELRELSFPTDVTDGNYYIVYLFTDSGSPLLDLDLRGH
jgi:hypothetical protein